MEQKEESSHGELVVNAARFSSSLEKLVFRKAGTTGKKSEILRENKSGSVPVHGVAVLVSCVDVAACRRVCVLSMYACE